MDCRHIQRRMSEGIDGTLGARETWELERHLAGCPACARARVELQRTVAALGTAPRAGAPDGFMLRLNHVLRDVEPASPPFAWPRTLRGAFRARALSLGGAAAAAGVLALLLLYRPQPSPYAAPVGSEAQAAAFQHVAATAVDPLQDVAAANLTATASTDSAMPEGAD